MSRPARFAAPLAAFGLDAANIPKPPTTPPPNQTTGQTSPWRRMPPGQMALAIAGYTLVPGLILGGLGAAIASGAGAVVATGFAVGAAIGAALGLGFLYAVLKIAG